MPGLDAGGRRIAVVIPKPCGTCFSGQSRPGAVLAGDTVIAVRGFPAGSQNRARCARTRGGADGLIRRGRLRSDGTRRARSIACGRSIKADVRARRAIGPRRAARRVGRIAKRAGGAGRAEGRFRRGGVRARAACDGICKFVMNRSVEEPAVEGSILAGRFRLVPARAREQDEHGDQDGEPGHSVRAAAALVQRRAHESRLWRPAPVYEFSPVFFPVFLKRLFGNSRRLSYRPFRGLTRGAWRGSRAP
jgi:hypothetical protein